MFKVFLPESMHTCCPLPSWDSLSRRCRRGRAWAWPRRFGSRGGPEPHRPRGCWGCKTKLKTRQRSMVMMFCVGKSFSNVFCGRKICEEWNKYRITVEVLIFYFFVRIHVFFSFQHTYLSWQIFTCKGMPTKSDTTLDKQTHKQTWNVSFFFLLLLFWFGKRVREREGEKARSCFLVVS